MKPNISEFSYGYAITEELVTGLGNQLSAAPVFPSLYQEGQSGGGYDLMLARPGAPLFLQFKLSDCMRRSNAKEIRDGSFAPPCYRMHLRSARYSQQHEMLLDLETTGQDVYYCAPAFHTPDELNDAYLMRQVGARSKWIRPSEIGPLADKDDHYVAFQLSEKPRRYSQPQTLNGIGGLHDFQEQVQDSLRRKGRDALTPSALHALADALRAVTEKRRDIDRETKRRVDHELKVRHPMERISFYAQVFMDCRLFVVQTSVS